MRALPKRMRQVVRQVEETFSERVWEWAKLHLIGAILAKGRENGRGNRAGNGMLAGEAIPERSPSAQSCQMVEPRTQSPGVGVACRPVCSRKRAMDPGHG